VFPRRSSFGPERAGGVRHWEESNAAAAQSSSAAGSCGIQVREETGRLVTLLT
jgi:hypothetical protein